MNRSVKIAAAFAAFMIPAVAFAHHGWSSYDAKTVIKHSAKLTELSWGNPHAQAKVAYKDKSWDVILAPITRMEQRGLTRDMLAPDKTVTLEGYPRTDGTPEMRIERVTAAGKTVELR